jgi:hypothetical protein
MFKFICGFIFGAVLLFACFRPDLVYRICAAMIPDNPETTEAAQP